MDSETLSDDATRAYQESLKLSFESLKHLTTMSTGSIVVLATFLDKLFGRDPKWTGLAALALMGFVISLVSALATMWTLGHAMSDSYDREKSFPGRSSAGVTLLTAMISFVAGIAALAAFAVRNLLG